jgi:O-antigen/teichoic acid export membrane protein
MIKPVYLVTTPLIGLSLSSLSRAVRHPATAQQLVEAFHRVVAIALVPVSFGLALVGDNVMPTLGGDNWRDAGPLLSLLSLGIFAQGVVILNGYVLMASGHARACFFAGLALGIALIAGYLLGWLIGRSLGNPTLGIAGGYAVTITLAGLGPHNWFCLRTAGHRADSVARTWLPAAKASLAMALCVAIVGWVIPDTRPMLRMIVQIVVGLGTYLLLARGELRWLAGRFFTR